MKSKHIVIGMTYGNYFPIYPLCLENHITKRHALQDLSQLISRAKEVTEMTKLEVWLDKLPEDKAKCYNRTRMSMELFARKIGTSPQEIVQDFKRNGYIYVEEEHKVKLSPNPNFTRHLARLKEMKTLPD